MTATVFSPPGEIFMLLGALLFCAGTLLGIPHGISKQRGNLKRTELWRVAHLSTCVGGTSLIAMSIALEILFPTAAIYILVPLTLAAYCFFCACSLSGAFNKSWDDDRSDATVTFIYFLQIFASAMSILAVASVLIISIWKSI